MKLGKLSWLILASGVFIIAFASLGIAHFKEVNEQDKLRDELTVAETRLENYQLKQLSLQQGELQERLSQIILQLEENKAKFSQPNGSIVITDALFRIAEGCDVNISVISSSGLTRGTLTGISCSILPLDLSIQGSVPALIDFIAELEAGLVTSIVNSVVITIPEADEEESPSASIRVTVYSYQEK